MNVSRIKKKKKEKNVWTTTVYSQLPDMHNLGSETCWEAISFSHFVKKSWIPYGRLKWQALVSPSLTKYKIEIMKYSDLR